MMYLLLLIACYGLTFGIQYKVPFLHEKFYLLDLLLECPYCVGFWSGWAIWGLSWLVLEHPLLVSGTSVVQIIAAGFLWALISAAFCYMTDTVISRLEN